MLLEGVIHCGAPGCKTHEHVGADTMALGKLPPGWWVAGMYEHNGVFDRDAYCSHDCLLQALAKIPPTETYREGPDGRLHRDEGELDEERGE